MSPTSQRNPWQPPRLRSIETDSERHASWLELFFDLVFVVAVSELSHYLSTHISLQGFLIFVGLFLPIWWSWIGATFYATRFDTDDLGHRLLTLLQIAAVAALAVNVYEATGATAVGFALAYATVRLITIAEYIRVWLSVEQARPLARIYVRGFSLAMSLWVISVFVPPPQRFILWGMAMVVDFLTPLVDRRLITRIPVDVSHATERMGLFTIIVLGEAVLGAVRGVSEQEWNWLSALIAFLGLSIAFSFWWIYFDSMDNSPLQAAKAGDAKTGFVWLYIHLALVIGLAGTGVGVEKIVAGSMAGSLDSSARWVLGGSVVICLLAMAVLHGVTASLAERHRKMLSLYRLLAVAFALVMTSLPLPPLVFMGLIAATCLVQVGLELLRSHQLEPEQRAMLASGSGLLLDTDRPEDHPHPPDPRA
ncbi:MAG: low temperature requirement protein A [Cyanobacteriota bacterium]|nr:low temperature requirement protein A [Cyanobacteriota bacterium]